MTGTKEEPIKLGRTTPVNTIGKRALSICLDECGKDCPPNHIERWAKFCARLGIRPIPIWRKVVRFTLAFLDHAVHGFPTASRADIAFRWSVCKPCVYRTEKGNCAKCGCPLSINNLRNKLRLARQNCPLWKRTQPDQFWGPVKGEKLIGRLWKWITRRSLPLDAETELPTLPVIKAAEFATVFHVSEAIVEKRKELCIGCVNRSKSQDRCRMFGCQATGKGFLGIKEKYREFRGRKQTGLIHLSNARCPIQSKEYPEGKWQEETNALG